jgi:hypothetical protein
MCVPVQQQTQPASLISLLQLTKQVCTCAAADTAGDKEDDGGITVRVQPLCLRADLRADVGSTAAAAI